MNATARPLRPEPIHRHAPGTQIVVRHPDTTPPLGTPGDQLARAFAGSVGTVIDRWGELIAVELCGEGKRMAVVCLPPAALEPMVVPRRRRFTV